LAGGADYRPKGQPARVNVHDFADKELGKTVPYGVYDVAANAFVSGGITADTAEFAVAAIRTWLDRMGRQRYPKINDCNYLGVWHPSNYLLCYPRSQKSQLGRGPGRLLGFRQNGTATMRTLIFLIGVCTLVAGCETPKQLAALQAAYTHGLQARSVGGPALQSGALPPITGSVGATATSANLAGPLPKEPPAAMAATDAAVYKLGDPGPDLSQRAAAYCRARRAEAMADTKVLVAPSVQGTGKTGAAGQVPTTNMLGQGLSFHFPMLV
jgi:hypothetical protein